MSVLFFFVFVDLHLAPGKRGDTGVYETGQQQSITQLALLKNLVHDRVHHGEMLQMTFLM